MVKETFAYFLFCYDSALYYEPYFSLPLLLILSRTIDKQMVLREKIPNFRRQFYFREY